MPAQVVRLQPASFFSFPTAIVDGNSPGFWQDDGFTLYTSTGEPVAMRGLNLFSVVEDDPPGVEPLDHYPIWIESVWRDTDGTVYAWYHHEAGVCGGKLALPSIGALVSTDGGHNFHDLGIVLSSGDGVNCGAQNGFFAGGHGDVTVIPDRERQYFYFLFTNYGGAAQNQGVAIARMAFDERANPAGAVHKFYQGDWNEPGLGGAVTPIFPASVAWERSNTDSFWGPAVHWNTALGQYVVLLNRACCSPKWPQEGIYIALNPDLANPYGWSVPSKILDGRQIGFSPGWYPQVFGTGPGETDTLVGEVGRLFVKGVSKWEIVFSQ